MYRSVVALFACGMLCLSLHPMNNKKMLNKGALIALEGIDDDGKKTLAQALCTALTQRGFDVILSEEPGSTELGKSIHTIMQSPTTPISTIAQCLLFAADRAQHFEQHIIPALQQKKLIISGRFSDSLSAYRAYGQGLDIVSKIKATNQWAMKGIKPDFTIFLEPIIQHAYHNEKEVHTIKMGLRQMLQNRDDVVTNTETDSPEESCPLFCQAIEEWLQENNFYS